jgi:hypothetical protein
MTHLKLNGLPFQIENIDNIDMRDYPDFCDAYIEEATVFENDEWRSATDAEIDQANDELADAINEMIHDEQLYL